ncbi:unnamed protein product, partial [Polarella glacialis]
MAPSSDKGTSVDITLDSMSGEKITAGTWDGQCKAREVYQAVHRSKPGFRCKLLHGSQE